MKIMLVPLIAGFAFADLRAKDGPVEKIVEKIRKAIPEPIQFKERDLVIPDNVFVSGSLNATNFIASGLKAFTFKFELFPTSMEVGLEKFSLDTQYAMDLPVFKIPLLSIFGDGTLR
nr:unnamed protein product [Callosobruchus analis]